MINSACCIIQMTDMSKKKKEAKNVLFTDTVIHEDCRVWVIGE